MNEHLKSQYERGAQFLNARRESSTECWHEETSWMELAKMGKDRTARRLRDQFAREFRCERRAFLHDVQLAAAVETIVENCGEYARDLLLNAERQQSREAIMRLSRTADTRQRYRVEGVRDGHFRSVAPQNNDVVYDTIDFGEVLSRLRRARGAMKSLNDDFRDTVSPEISSELRRIIEMCREATLALMSLVQATSSNIPEIPGNLQRENVLAICRNPGIHGKLIGLGRLALRMTIKSVWDYPEMQRREILPSANERRQTFKESRRIVAVSNRTLHRLRPLNVDV